MFLFGRWHAYEKCRSAWLIHIHMVHATLSPMYRPSGRAEWASVISGNELYVT